MVARTFWVGTSMVLFTSVLTVCVLRPLGEDRMGSAPRAPSLAAVSTLPAHVAVVGAWAPQLSQDAVSTEAPPARLDPAPLLPCCVVSLLPVLPQTPQIARE